MKIRKKRVEPNQLEANKLQKRLLKLKQLHAHYKRQFKIPETTTEGPFEPLKPDNSTNSTSSSFDVYRSIKEAEMAISQWQHDESVLKCPHCDSFFGTFSKRRHHCRLCGKVVCASCTSMQKLVVSDSFVKRESSGSFILDNLLSSGSSVPGSFSNQDRTPNSSVGSSSVYEGSSNKVILGEIRVCSKCELLVFRKPRNTSQTSKLTAFISQQQEPPIVKLYETISRTRKKIEDEMPEYRRLLSELKTNDASIIKKDIKLQNAYNDANLKRKEILSLFSELDSAGKRVVLLEGKGDEKTEGKTFGCMQKLQKNIYQSVAIYLQENMFTLQALPKLQESTDKPSPPPPLNPEAQTFASVLEEQKIQLEKNIEDAKKQRRFDDVKALQQSLNEIEAELQRLHTS
jgi:rabenosyn-5